MIIYKITNLINGKVYIGKTFYSIKKRFKEHVQDSLRSNKENRPLYKAFNKYGIENFSIEEIDHAEDDKEACELEQKWIQYYNSYHKGYNATIGGDGIRLYDYKEVSDFYLDCKSVKQTCEYFDCDPQVVRNACKENNVNIIRYPQSKLVCRIDIKNSNNKVYFNSVKEAAQISFPDKDIETARKNISNALHRQHGKAYGYYWKYVNE